MKPSKIVCVGRNYREHAKELGNEVPPEPLLFLKPPSSLIANGQPIVLPPQSKQVEHEGEIGVVVGRQLRNASTDEARDAIQSIIALNDVTARDLQRKDSQWTRAKGFDTFCPIGEPAKGPVDLAGLTVVTRVNGVERQRGYGSDMVFAIPDLLAYISTVMTLEPGDVLATGTPSGVGVAMKPPAFVKVGDVMRAEIDGIGHIENSVVAEPV